jgi:hypothetical protein
MPAIKSLFIVQRNRRGSRRVGAPNTTNATTPTTPPAPPPSNSGYFECLVARGHALRTPQPQQFTTSSAKLASFRQNPKTPLRAAPNLLLSTRMPRRLPARPPPQPPRSPAGMDAAPGDFQTLLTRPCSPRSPCIKPYPSFGSVCSEQAGRYNL